mgnify:CR=1 FL=1
MLCRHCQSPVSEKRQRKRASFCQDKCRRIWQTINDRDPEVKRGQSTGATGAISELRVCADLLQRGYEVFRSVSQATSCDLIALKDTIFTRIEVRTGKYTKNRLVLVNRDMRADVLAICLHDQIVYEPPFEEE